MSTQKFNYQDYLTGYTMPFNYLWALLVVTEDKDFVLELADLVYNSEIVITVFDDYTVTSSSNTEKYTVILPRGNETKESVPREKEYTKTTTTITTTYNTKVDLTRANVWIVDYEQKFEYKKLKNGSEWTLKDKSLKEKTELNLEKKNFETILYNHLQAKDRLGYMNEMLYELIEYPDNGIYEMLNLTKYLLQIAKTRFNK